MVRQRPRPPRLPVYFKEWRQFRHMTQVQAAERIGIEQATLSRIERSVILYTQDFLERAAFTYACAPGDLITRNPLDHDAVLEVAAHLREASPAEQEQALAVIAALLKRTH